MARDPGHSLDSQRVHGKQGGRQARAEGTRPGTFEAAIAPTADEQGHRQDIEDHGVGDLEEQAGEMVALWVELAEDILRPNSIHASGW